MLASRLRLGFDTAMYKQELISPKPYPSHVNAFNGSLTISGSVMNQGKPMTGVLVQLRQHIAAGDEDTIQEAEMYTRTDEEGKFYFEGLIKDSGYSVVPLKPGFEFGARQGTAQLVKSAFYTFRARPHRLRLIGALPYGQLKENNAFIVRTPAEFRYKYWAIVGIFIAAFFIVHLIFVISKFNPDPFLLPLLMLLSGISILILFSIQNPLQDTLYAGQALQGVLIGLTAFTLLSRLNIGRLYMHWWFDWLFNFKKKEFYHLKGWTWLVMAVLLAVYTMVAGTGPEGSGVKVNIQLLGITFQSSEITKYLLLIFFAGFFAANEERIRNFSDPRWRFAVSWSVMAGAGVMLGLYLLMGDMGPALIVCLTFLVFYSIARGNLLVTVSAGILYGLLLLLLPGLVATFISFLAVVIFMIFRGQVKSTKWYGWFGIFVEAPVMLLLIMATFTFGDKIPGVGNRLADRKAMWLSQWNNDVYGGDQLAHSYWTLSSGGFTGQGLGKGSPNTMPAAHTDMILPSIGEELGWLGLVSVFLLFGILIHRIFLHAYRAGQPFSFYLCAGIAIATAIQFLLIAGGSIGLMPLTGVAVPFLSYGKISLIINLAAMGIVAAISAKPGAELQKEYIRRHYDPVLITGIAGFMIGIMALIIRLFIVQVAEGSKYIVKPARIISRDGLPMFSYNPRIDKLTRLLGAGNIYDRNGLVLATGDTGKISSGLDSLNLAGLDVNHLQDMIHKQQRRYYPFEAQMFFWTGDYNTRLFWGQSNGYYAEATHLSTLRGFETRPQKSNYFTTRYRPDKFTKPLSKNVDLVSYDYTPLAASLRSGIDTNNAEVLKIKNSNRDIHLSVDAALQVALQNKLNESALKNKRISVVVLDATTGDILASAVHPLPDLQEPDLLLLPQKDMKKVSKLITERDLGMTYATAPGSAAKIVTATAAFNKMGLDAANVKYTDISHDEIIRKGGAEEEPYISNDIKYIDMRLAIVRSSNIFFIRMANDFTLDNEMASLYMAIGMNINLYGGYNYKNTSTITDKEKVLNRWKQEVFNYRDRNIYRDKKLLGKRERYNSLFSGLAWGQGNLTSTPASLARMAGAIANKGILVPSRYLLEAGEQPQQVEPGITVAKDSHAAAILEGFMKEQSAGKIKYHDEVIKVAGKTGTPQREVNRVRKSDGWYVFFAPTPDNKSFTVVCIRVELGELSSKAVSIANEIIGILIDKGYISSF